MKRSDMIKLIEDIIFKCALNVRSIDGDVYWKLDMENTARNLLEMIEDAGMLPPVKEVDVASDFILHIYPHHQIKDENFKVTDLWEPENEKK